MRNGVYLGGIVLAVALAAHFAFDASRAGAASFFVVYAAPTVALAVLAVVRARFDGVLSGWLAVRSGDFTRGFVAAAVIFGAAYVFMKTVTPPDSAQASWWARLYLQFGDPAVLRRHVPLVVAAIAGLAIAEELVWRGLVVSLLEEKVGSRRAWVWAAVLYGLAHAPSVWALRDPLAGPNPVVVLGALGAGLVWGGMARAFGGRLLPSMFSHMLVVWAVVMMFRLWGPSV